MSTAVDTNGDSSPKTSKRGFGKVLGSPKNVMKAPNKIAGTVQKGTSNVTSNLQKGANFGAGAINSGVNTGISGVTKGVGAITKNLKYNDSSVAIPVEKPKEVVKPKLKPIKRKLNTDLATFDWENVGGFQDGVDKGGDGQAMLAKSEAMRTYLSDAYYSDFYVNTILTIGTCFFGWAVGRIFNSFLWLGVVFLCVASVYRAEFRRFVRDTRDDMLRLSISDRLENETETLEWCNNLLSKVWIVYMPLMGDIVKTNVNPILAGVAPGGGIDSIELTHFHLGSVAPKVTGIKSYTKIGKSSYEMDWAFAFDPNNRENMTKAEIRKQIMPKVVIKAAIGKGIISKKVPINVEDMGFVGRMKIRLTFTEKFPMIEFIRVQFLEPPKIEYALKPIGGDTLGIDIMKFIPGLKSIINEGINWGIKNFLIEPNYQEVNLVDIMSAASTDISSVLVVNLKEIALKSSGDYYAVLSTANSAEDKKIKTDTKLDTKNPVWNTSYYLLNNSIDQDMLISVYKVNSFGKDKLIGTAEYDLTECYQSDKLVGLSAKVESSGKNLGYVNFDLSYFPELEAPVEEDGSKGPIPQSEVGILKFVLNEAKGLDVSSSLVGQISPYAEIYFNGKLKHKTRVLKRSNEPSFGDIIETLVRAKSDTIIKILIKDSVGFAEDTLLGEFESSLEDILSQIESSSNPLFKMAPSGVVKITPQWRPLGLTKIASDVTKDPLGVFRIHLRDATDLKNLELRGKVDPYVSVLLNGKTKYETIIHPETLNPVFEEVCYVPVTSENQYIALEVFDAEKNGKDRLLGSTSFKADKYLKKSPSGQYFFIDGSNKSIKSALFLPKASTSKGYLTYSVSFIPTVSVYSAKELKELAEEEKKIQEQLKKEEEEQKKLKELYEKNPDNYEWVEVDSPLTHRDVNKKQMSLQEALSYDSGLLNIKVIKGDLEHKKAFLEFLVDEVAYPGATAGPASNGTIATTLGSIFIRDLKNSTLVVRETSKEYVEEEDDVYKEKSFPTAQIIEKSHEVPTTLELGDGSKITVQCSYSPSNVALAPSDLMSDTGSLTLDILHAKNLIAADDNGKSDPFLVLKLNGAQVFKTEIIKKTLDPEFNQSVTFPIPSLSRTRLSVEAFDFDKLGDNDYIGEGLIDISKLVGTTVPVDIATPLTLEGKDGGVVFFRAKFEPKYIRPKIEKFGGGLPGIGAVAGAPVKLVGGAGKAAVGGIGLLATGVGKGVGKSGKLLGFGGKNKKRNSVLIKNNDSDAQSTINGDASFGPTSSRTPTYLGNGGDTSMLTVGTNGATGAGNTSQLSTQVSTLFGGKRSTGRITIKQLNTADETHSSLSIKVVLSNTELGHKEVYKTRKNKLTAGSYKFAEEATFKAIPEDELIFQALVPHRLGKDNVVAEGKISVNSVVDNADDLTVELGSFGTVLINVRYSAPS